MTVVTKALAVLGLCCLGAATAHAQAPADPSEAHPFVAEFHTGSNDPLGRFGLALAYDKGGRFSAGLGLGLDSIDRELVMGASLFGRARLLRLGSFTLDTGAILSRGGHQTTHIYPSSFSTAESFTWTWSPEYRLTGTLGVGVIGRRWSLRLEGGLGYRLNRPTCTYEGSRVGVSGDCHSPLLPAEYHPNDPPDRFSTTFSLTLGYRLGVEDDAAGAESQAHPAYRSPSKAQSLSAWSTALPVLLGGTLISLATSNRSDNVTLPVMGGLSLGLGLSLGPSVGYAYAGESVRGWGVGALRVLGYGLGTVFIYGSLMTQAAEYHDRSDVVTYGVVGLTLFGASLASSMYDLIAVPKAAERTNAKNGLTNLSVLPVPIAGPSSVGPGLALGGQF
jgi:hypothetical protein